MSNLLEQASLVMIPSGYKEDIVYSEIPIDGSGDLQFTRSSNGTRVNSAGLVEVCPWNLAEQSNAFNTSPWVSNNQSGTTPVITANYGTAPDGTQNAFRIQLARTNINSSYSQIYQYPIAVVIGQTYTWSVWLKSLSGTPTISIMGDFGRPPVTLTSEWVRYTGTATATTSLTQLEIAILGSNYSTGNSLSADFLAYGYQLNIGSTAKPYFPTTDRLNVPRLTYQNGGGGCPSLLLEKQSTNLLTYSEQFDNAGWTKSDSTVTANATTSPDGTTNADKLIESATTASHLISQASATSASVVTTSVFLKQSELRYAVVFISNTVNKNFAVLFDLQLGVVVTNFTSISSYAAPTSSSIENYGNGWFRCIVTATDTFTNASCAVALNRSGADSGFSYTGDGTSGLFIWGAQLE